MSESESDSESESESESSSPPSSDSSSSPSVSLRSLRFLLVFGFGEFGEFAGFQDLDIAHPLVLKGDFEDILAGFAEEAGLSFFVEVYPVSVAEGGLGLRLAEEFLHFGFAHALGEFVRVLDDAQVALAQFNAVDAAGGQQGGEKRAGEGGEKNGANRAVCV